MPRINDNAIQIQYETLGNSEHPALLLISGLGEQMIAWPDTFCRTLADNKLFVIRFDNRDTGLSTKLDALGVPDLHTAWGAYFQGRSISPPYTLHDMAADAIRVLNALEIPCAFVCGFSLGGMIAQNLAFAFPERLAGMICMASSTGDLQLPPPSPKAQATMATPPPSTREAFVEHMVSVFEVFSAGSPAYDAVCHAEIAARSYDRCFYPIGFIRQSVAMLADGNRQGRLAKVNVPTLVLQGQLDPVAQPEHGKALAGAVPAAEFVLVSNWGHGLDYPNLWPLLARNISNFVQIHSATNRTTIASEDSTACRGIEQADDAI